MSDALRAPKGTRDLLPPESEAYRSVLESLQRRARLAGYRDVQTPLFEDTGLFERGVGGSSDVVAKEMYSFTDRGGRPITLRPEGTAGVVRAVLQAGLHRGPLPVKLQYAGAYFRYERPQAGRYREFRQFGVEALGTSDPALDAEVVWLGARALADAGLTGVSLLVNSLGDPACRPGYDARLRAFLAGLPLDPPTRQRAELNPLRVLDDKRPEVAELLVDAPRIIDALCADCRVYDGEVRAILTDLGVPLTDAPRLVRGLDYYTRTTFEYVHEGLGAQSAVGGGGRYDGLAQTLGGPALPGIGLALGLDRLLLALRAEHHLPAEAPRCAVFAVSVGDAARRELIRLVAALRDAGVPADFSYGTGGLKGALRAADRSGARLAVLAGPEDLAAERLQVKDLVTGAQTAVGIMAALAEIVRRVGELA